MIVVKFNPCRRASCDDDGWRRRAPPGTSRGRGTLGDAPVRRAPERPAATLTASFKNYPPDGARSARGVHSGMPVPVAETRAHLNAMRQRREHAATARAAALRGLLPSLAADLRASVGLRDFVLFGSFARGDVHDESDVDLAVSGVPAPQFLRVLGRCSAALSYDVHLIELERASDSLRARIAAEGIAY